MSVGVGSSLKRFPVTGKVGDQLLAGDHPGGVDGASRARSRWRSRSSRRSASKPCMPRERTENSSSRLRTRLLICSPRSMRCNASDPLFRSIALSQHARRKPSPPQPPAQVSPALPLPHELRRGAQYLRTVLCPGARCCGPQRVADKSIYEPARRVCRRGTLRVLKVLDHGSSHAPRMFPHSPSTDRSARPSPRQWLNEMPVACPAAQARRTLGRSARSE